MRAKVVTNRNGFADSVGGRSSRGRGRRSMDFHLRGGRNGNNRAARFVVKIDSRELLAVCGSSVRASRGLFAASREIRTMAPATARVRETYSAAVMKNQTESPTCDSYSLLEQ